MEGCNKESNLSLPHMLKSCFTLSLRWLEQNSAYMEIVEQCGHAGEKTIKKPINVPPLLLHVFEMRSSTVEANTGEKQRWTERKIIPVCTYSSLGEKRNRENLKGMHGPKTKEMNPNYVH